MIKNDTPSWIDYMLIAAEHSQGSAKHWFRYLRKYIDKCDVVFTNEDIEKLYQSDLLTPFQRVSLRAAFEEGSPTREHILSLNQTIKSNILSELREKHEL